MLQINTQSPFCLRQQATTIGVCLLAQSFVNCGHAHRCRQFESIWRSFDSLCSHRCRRTCQPCWCRCEARGRAWCRWHHRCPSQRPTWRLFALPDRVHLSQMDETETHRQFPLHAEKDKGSLLTEFTQLVMRHESAKRHFFSPFITLNVTWKKRLTTNTLTKARQNDSQRCFSELRNAAVLLLGCLKELCLTCSSPTAGGQFWHGLKKS